MRAIASAKLANTPDHQQNGGRDLELMPYSFLFIGITDVSGSYASHRRFPSGVHRAVHSGPSRASSTPDAIDADRPPMQEAFGSGYVAIVFIRNKKLIHRDHSYSSSNDLSMASRRSLASIGCARSGSVALRWWVYSPDIVHQSKRRGHTSTDTQRKSTQMSAQLPYRSCRGTYRRPHRRNSTYTLVSGPSPTH